MIGIGTAKAEHGFTLIELLVVIVIIAIIAAIALPMLYSARIRANETVARQTLRNLASQQKLLHSMRAIDCNRNGQGEYGFFQELSGGRRLRSGDPASAEGPLSLVPPVLPSAFARIDTNGRLYRSGYFFQVYLPSPNGGFLAEQDPTAPYPAVDAQLCETAWGCYAWPGAYQRSGNTAFYIDHRGELLSTTNRATGYSNTNVPQATAVLSAKATYKTSMTHSLATNTTGVDGNFWVVTN